MQKSLNDEEKQLIEELASYFFTPREIAEMLEMEPSELIEDPVFMQLFKTGRFQSEMELRKAIVKLAKSGSSPAQTMSLDMLNKSKLKILDRWKII